MYLVPFVVARPSWKWVKRPGCTSRCPFGRSVMEQLYLIQIEIKIVIVTFIWTLLNLQILCFLPRPVGVHKLLK